MLMTFSLSYSLSKTKESLRSGAVDKFALLVQPSNSEMARQIGSVLTFMAHLRSEEPSVPNRGILNLRFDLGKSIGQNRHLLPRDAALHRWSQLSADDNPAQLCSPCRFRSTAHQKGQSVNKGQHNIEFTCRPDPRYAPTVVRAMVPVPNGAQADKCNDYYDARQAGIFDSSCPPLFLVQSLSFFWYSSSSFHRYGVLESSILRIMPKVFRRIAIRARPYPRRGTSSR